MPTKTKRITLQRFINESDEVPEEAIYKDRYGEADPVSASKLFVDVLK